jgi:hypothetical protein
MVSVLAIGTKVRGFKPSLGDGFLKAVKIMRTPSFGGEVNPEAIRFYNMLKNYTNMKEVRIILFRHTTTTFWYYYIFLVYHNFLTLLVLHVSGYCNPSSGTFIKQFTRLRVASQYPLHWMCSNCKIHLL